MASRPSTPHPPPTHPQTPTAQCYTPTSTPPLHRPTRYVYPTTPTSPITPPPWPATPYQCIHPPAAPAPRFWISRLTRLGTGVYVSYPNARLFVRCGWSDGAES